MKTILRTVILFISVLSFENILAITPPCKGRLVNPVTDICLDCYLPITMGPVRIKTGSNPDTKNPSKRVCTCGSFPNIKVGTPLGYWEPMALVDVTRSPYCMVNLGGIRLPQVSKTNKGDITLENGNENNSFFHVHHYNFPLVALLGIFPSECRAGGVFMQVKYMSELDPTWHNEALALTLFPETAQFANLTAQTACSVDAAKSLVGLPVDSLFWCAGSQGAMYPVTGHVGEHVSGVQASVLLTERLMFKQNRLGVVKNSSSSNLCSQKYTPNMPKSRYRYQMVNPVATTNKKGCQPFGRSTMVWQTRYGALSNPATTENYGYLVWRKRNCCVF